MGSGEACTERGEAGLKVNVFGGRWLVSRKRYNALQTWATTECLTQGGLRTGLRGDSPGFPAVRTKPRSVSPYDQGPYNGKDRGHTVSRGLYHRMTRGRTAVRTRPHGEPRSVSPCDQGPYRGKDPATR